MNEKKVTSNALSFQATGSRLGLLTMTIFTLLAAIIIAFVHGWQLTLLILACVPIVIIANAIRARSMAGHALKDQKALEEAGRVSSPDQK